MANKLTDKERTVLGAFNESPAPYSNWEGGVSTEDSGTFHTVFTEEIVGVLGNSTLQGAKMVVTSLIKKGFLTSKDMDNEGESDHWIELTDAGVEMISDLHLEDEELALALDEDDDEEQPDAYEERLAGQRKAAQADAKDKGKPSLRTSHANCTHATHGKEGKIARAKCRRERAAAAKALEAKATANA